MATRSMASITRQAPTGMSVTEDWREQAFCKDWDFKKKGDPWHPDSESRIAAMEGKNLCGACPVRYECLFDAINTDSKHGIRGGATPDERKNLKRQRKTLSTN